MLIKKTDMLYKTPWKKLSQHYGYDGWRKILVRQFELPNGKKVAFDVLESPSYVTIMPVTTDGRWICVRQYRPGPERFLTGFPEGGLDSEETAEEAAGRELLEETGYRAGQLVLLQSRRSAYTTQTQYFVLALDCEPVAPQRLDAHEFIEVLTYDTDDLLRMLRSNNEAFNNIAAAYLALDHLRMWIVE